MSSWSINGTVRTVLSAQRSLTLGARGDSCSLRVAGTLALTHGSACVVATSDGTFFRGLVRRCAPGKYLDNGVTVAVTVIELESKLRLLERLVYSKAIPTGDDDTLKASTRVVLCQDGATTAAEMAAVVSFASAHLSISSTLTGTVAPGWEMTDASVAEVLGSLLRFHPEAVVWYDHANDVLRIQPLASTPQITKAMDVAEGALGGEFATASPVAVAGVRLIYNVTTTVDGVAYRDTVEDTAGSTSGLDVVTSTFDWSGGTYQTFRQRQEIVTEAIPQSTGATNIKNWVRKKVPEMGLFATGDFKISAISQRNPDGEATVFERELVSGSIQDWMPDSVVAARVEVTVVVDWIRATPIADPALREAAREFFGLSRRRVVVVELVGTSATSQTYLSTPVVSGGDDDDGPPPTGVAARIYNNRPLAGPQGAASWRSAMPDLALHAGARLTVTGCLEVTDALIQTVSESSSGAAGGLETTTSVSCGPNGFLLSAEPFQRLQRAMARAARHRPRVPAALAPSGNVDGAKRAPGSSGKMKPRDGAIGFQVTWERAGWVVVREGLVCYPVWPEEIDPEDPRPVRYAERKVPTQGFSVGPGESLWLELNLSAVNYSLEGALGGFESVSLQGGRGGRGGRGGLGGYGGDGGMGGTGGMGGGGGGGGGGAGPGSAGSAGNVGGYGGVGGASGGGGGGADAGGAGGAGGLGGSGASGSPGSPPPPFGHPDGPVDGVLGDLPSPVQIQIPTTTALLARVWQLDAGLGVGVVKGPTAAGKANESTAERIFIRLADITETQIIPHHQGTFFLPPMIVPMIPPAAEEGAG